ncbi:hypothetical protein C0991_008465 [Blastosporella zonata]|nr:hypothetical protein C0991_008465 [Blastosporella zonata]
MIKGGFDSRQSITLFSAMVISFVLTSAFWAAKVALCLKRFKYGLMDQTLDTWNSQTFGEFAKVDWRFAVAVTAIQEVLLALSNVIIIWRAWVIFPSRRWILALPIFLVVAGTVCGITHVALLSSNFQQYIAYSDLLFALVNILHEAALVLSFAGNATATLLIIYTLISHIQHRRALGLYNRNSTVLKVIAILVDTGACFLIIQVMGIILYLTPAEKHSRLAFFQAIVSMSVTIFTVSIIHHIKSQSPDSLEIFLVEKKKQGMYPMIVISLVNRQRSLVEVFGFDNPNNLPNESTITLDPLQFSQGDSMFDPIVELDTPLSDKGSTTVCGYDGNEFESHEMV